jgi:4'-phosphopantetheinyl transferase
MDLFGAQARTLPGDERRRAEHYRHPAARNQFVVGRGLLRTILGSYLGVPPERLVLGTGPQGKPALEGPCAGPLFFNVSHSHGLALFAVTALGELGVDVEQVRPRINHLDLAARFFAPQEAATLRALPAEASVVAFYNAWTRKEAILKATGLGLSYGPERVEVALLPGDEARAVRVGDDDGAAARWSLRHLTPAEGYVGALALERHGYALRCWSWPPGG